MKLFHNLLFVASISIFSGCTVFQNISVNDLKNEKYFRNKYILNKTIKEINEAVYIYSNECKSLGNFSINPANPKVAQMVYKGMGFTQSSVYALFTFKEQNDKTTLVKLYTYHSTWASLRSEKVINALKSPKTCQ